MIAAAAQDKELLAEAARSGPRINVAGTRTASSFDAAGIPIASNHNQELVSPPAIS
jgi:hypothetical protein